MLEGSRAVEEDCPIVAADGVRDGVYKNVKDRPLPYESPSSYKESKISPLSGSSDHRNDLPRSERT